MKPQDCLVLLKIIALGKAPWLGKDLAQSLGLSTAEISMSLERSRTARLLDDSKHRVRTGTLLDFLVYGLKVVFPIELGGLVRGIPTAWSIDPLAKDIRSEDSVVWPSLKGTLRGSALAPLYASAPDAALSDPTLHGLLALTDALRIGRVRETKLAQAYLKEAFDAYALAES